MLREAKNVQFVRTSVFFMRRYTITVGKKQINVMWKPPEFESMSAEMQQAPVACLQYDGRQYWWFRERFYWEDDGLTVDDVTALLMDRERRKQRQLERAHTTMQIDRVRAAGLRPLLLSWFPVSPPGTAEPLYELRGGDDVALLSMADASVRELRQRSWHEPIELQTNLGWVFWTYRYGFYVADQPVSAKEVVAFAANPKPAVPQRPSIPLDVRKAVFERDGGACVECGSNFDIQYDHIIPFSMGGSSNFENLQILCGDCNRKKGASLG